MPNPQQIVVGKRNEEQSWPPGDKRPYHITLPSPTLPQVRNIAFLIDTRSPSSLLCVPFHPLLPFLLAALYPLLCELLLLPSLLPRPPKCSFAPSSSSRPKRKWVAGAGRGGLFPLPAGKTLFSFPSPSPLALLPQKDDRNVLPTKTEAGGKGRKEKGGGRGQKSILPFLPPLPPPLRLLAAASVKLFLGEGVSKNVLLD